MDLFFSSGSVWMLVFCFVFLLAQLSFFSPFLFSYRCNPRRFTYYYLCFSAYLLVTPCFSHLDWSIFCETWMEFNSGSKFVWWYLGQSIHFCFRGISQNRWKILFRIMEHPSIILHPISHWFCTRGSFFVWLMWTFINRLFWIWCIP